MIRLGVDVGGTFTDVTAVDTDSGHYEVFKLPTTPADQSVAVAEGLAAVLARLGAAADRVSYVGHGTTVATNALLEHRGATVALLVTGGLRDIMEIARQKRPSLYNLMADKPAPLALRRNTFEVAERLGADGETIAALDEARLAELVAKVRASGAEAVAICLLNSYRNPVHEQSVERSLRKAEPDLYVCRSSAIAPEFREYERFSTTLVNAFVGPGVTRYTQRLAERVSSIGVEVVPKVIQSNGGLMSLTAVAERPVTTLMSGPSAGVVGASYLAGLVGVPNVITLDMGGTSTDVCLVRDGEAAVGNVRLIAGYVARTPAVDIHTIGAGGGSVAHVDRGGALLVGPRSAGAEPGPAAYGHGGREPTVTDANVMRGRLNPGGVLGGNLPLDVGAAQQVMAELGTQLAMPAQQVARSICRVANANMARAVRAVSVEIGEDPRHYVLMAFGGAGPLHAVEVAAEVGIHEVLIPPSPGTLCALGLLVTDIRTDLARSCLVRATPDALEQINRQWSELIDEAQVWLEEEAERADSHELVMSADMRYERQNFELNIAVGKARVTPEALSSLVATFHEAHQKAYGFEHRDASVQIVNLRITAIGHVSRVVPQTIAVGAEQLPEDAVVGHRTVDFQSGAVDTPIVDRARLLAGNRFDGPTIVEQLDSTTVVPPGARCRVDAYGNLRIEVQR